MPFRRLDNRAVENRPFSQLFAAKTSDNKWFQSSSQDVKSLKEGMKTDFIESLIRGLQLDGEFGVEDVLEDMPKPRNKEIHLLVVVPEGVTSNMTTAPNSFDFDKLKAVVKEAVDEVISQESKSTHTSAHLGQIELERLKDAKSFVKEEPKGDGDAFWPEDRQPSVDVKTEHDFILHMTPLFDEILKKHNLVFVNSENNAWLSQSLFAKKNTNLKPDGFATHCAMYDDKSEGKGYRCGLAYPGLFDSLILFEAKLNIDHTALGKVIYYLQLLAPKIPASAVLFTPKLFWLIQSDKGAITKIQVVKWVNNGSRKIFENFIQENVSPWVKNLSLACTNFNVDVNDGKSYLGRGSFGRVFKVAHQTTKEICALKIVARENVKGLLNEASVLIRAMDTNLTVTLVGQMINCDDYGAILLSPVGEPLSFPKSFLEIKALFDHLLKLHKEKICHGDPRVPNVIVHNERLLWIDLVGSSAIASYEIENDTVILTKSILKKSHNESLKTSLMEAINAYVSNVTQEKMDKVAVEVYESLR